MIRRLSHINVDGRLVFLVLGERVLIVYGNIRCDHRSVAVIFVDIKRIPRIFSNPSRIPKSTYLERNPQKIFEGYLSIKNCPKKYL